MVNYIEPNLQEIIFGPIRIGLITQKTILGPFKELPFLGPDPLPLICNMEPESGCCWCKRWVSVSSYD
jgi:hypothetical protein